ncbi:MAG: RNA-binding transcriptional accessory protein [Planctomycetes bacterium]|nr:RNA-binding transcriptional accessory protein [Planctomycetota bacterium]
MAIVETASAAGDVTGGAKDYDPTDAVAQELSLAMPSVGAVLTLLAGGATVPFIARYRKEATGGLDEVQIRAIEERAQSLRELEARRRTVLQTIASQGKLDAALEQKIRGCATMAALEDLYLPYKPKRRTRASIARERGLEPLAERLLAQPLEGDPKKEAEAYVDAAKELPDVEAVLQGARDICAEVLSERADLRAFLRERVATDGVLISERVEEKTQEPTRFEIYYDFREKFATIPSHRFLAIRRGENEGVLRTKVDLPVDAVLDDLRARVGLVPRSPFRAELDAALEDGLKRLALPSVVTDVRVDLKLRSDRAAVEVFAGNLSELLLASPLGPQSVIGIDPGLRTGCKCVAVDATGKFLEHVTIFLVGASEERAARELLAFVKRHGPVAIAVGNGTGGRETEAFTRKVLRDGGVSGVVVVAVNEAGASVYSASEVAREEFPDLDLTLRGAISIARRLQDPLAELVKIEPKSIGVGQYQHDVHQPLLARKLDEVIESCVNKVGVDLNTASAPLLSRVAGIGPSLAKRIVERREQRGAFRSRKQLLEVAGLGPRTFEQCAGFLRVRGGEHPLDASAVHPERYALVERMATDLGSPLPSLIGAAQLVKKLDLARYVGGDVGEPTLRDILSELEKPGRDPRSSFEPPAFRDDVQKLEDLVVGMELEGIVTNVTAFGAFVDVGVHQDGLVHVSELSDRFIQDPAEAVKVGQRVKVRVLSVDLPRKRIALSARSGEGPKRGGERRTDGDGPRGERNDRGGRDRSAPPRATPQPPSKGQNNPFKNLKPS